MIAPSNSVPCSVLIVIGEKDFHRIFSQMFVAMNKLIPEPNPYPFYSNSSKRMTITPAEHNWNKINKALKAPNSPKSPYIPETK